MTSVLVVVAKARASLRASRPSLPRPELKSTSPATKKRLLRSPLVRLRNEEHKVETVLNTAQNCFEVAEIVHVEEVLAVARKQVVAAQTVWDATTAEIKARKELYQARADLDAAVSVHLAAQNAHKTT